MIREFIRLEASSGVILLIAAVLALVFDNTPHLHTIYQDLFGMPVTLQVGALILSKPLLLWINEGFMAVFFLLVGLEIKREINERIVLDDSDIVTVVDKMIKQRRDSAKQFQDAGRNELADKELAEIIFLEPYMPSLLSEDEVITLIEKTVQSTGANSMKDMGKLMAELKPQLQGRADIGQVSQKIKKLLS